jgi:hypothetical protein
MSNQIAQTIKEQIGNRALVMIGAKDLLAGDNYLSLHVGRNPRGATHIRVALEPDDTYTVESLRWRHKRINGIPELTKTVIASTSDVYAEQLCQAIEAVTGLYTSL